MWPLQASRFDSKRGGQGMLVVETVARIRREHFIKGKTIKEIARDLKVSRNTVRRILRSGETWFEYEREVQPRPKLGRWTAELDELLASNAAKAAREQLTLIRIFEELRGRGYDGGYDAVRRYARRWAKERGQSMAAAYVPLSFAPGEAFQFDWSHEVVLLSGVTVIVKVAHVRLCHSRMLFVRAYPRETQEMVFDAHDRAFVLFKGACGRGIYDNMKTAVETVFVGKDRLYNRRFLQMCSHYLIEPVACTPASGWEKGQVENQVGLVRERFFTPRLRFKTYEEMNAWLLDKCIAYAKAHRHPELTEQTIWEVFEAERPKLVPYAGRFDGFHAVPASVSKTCLVRFDNNKYSVAASAVGRPVEVHAMRTASSSARTGGSSPSIRAHLAAATRSTTPGITCRCSPVSPAPCATAHRSRTGCCRPRWSACGANLPAPTTVIGRWSTSSARSSPTDCRRSRRPARKRLRRASTPLMSSSTSWPASVIPARRP
jgi:transposase